MLGVVGRCVFSLEGISLMTLPISKHGDAIRLMEQIRKPFVDHRSQ
jgi:hypothetical protein